MSKHSIGIGGKDVKQLFHLCCADDPGRGGGIDNQHPSKDIIRILFRRVAWELYLSQRIIK